MLLHYARAFAPWILLAVVSGWNDQAGAATGLVAAVLLLSYDLRRGHRADSLILELSTTVFMALLTALAFANPDSPLLNYGASMAIGWLALTAWATVLIRHPFTAGIARRNVTPEIAATPLFRKITQTIAIAWAGGFTATAIVLGIAQHATPGNTLLLVIVKICGFTIPAVFTARYPETAQKRYFAGLNQPHPAPPAPGQHHPQAPHYPHQPRSQPNRY